jgi:DNA-binding GntR family transcriptional regulator
VATARPEDLPIARMTLRDEASRRLRSEIASGVLAPATLYPIAEIAQRLGVSITPVREALLELANDGLIEIVRNRGFRIIEVTDDDLDEIVSIRLLLEVAPVRELAGKLKPADHARLSEIAHAVDQAATDGDMARFLELDRDFHLSLLGLGGNQRLVTIVSKLRDETRLYGLGRIAGTKALYDTAHEHLLLLDALKAGDANKADAIITGHLRHARGVWA